MKTEVFWCILLSISAAMVGCSSREGRVGVSATVEAARYEPNEEEAGDVKLQAVVLTYEVEWRNQSGTVIRVPTKGFSRLANAYPNSITSKIYWDSEPQKGRDVLSSGKTDEFGIVELKNGQAALVRWTEIEFSESRLNNIEIVVYVSKAFAKEYECWGGERKVFAAASRSFRGYEKNIDR